MFVIQEKDAEELLQALRKEVCETMAVSYLLLYCKERKKNPNLSFNELWNLLPDVVPRLKVRNVHQH